MKSDFVFVNEQLSQRGIVSICTDLYMRPQRKGNLYYVKSPVTADRHASLCLYPTTNTFVDYANGGQHGDVVGLIAYTQGCNQWDALQVLRDYYGLSSNKEGDSQKAKQQIKVQQEQDRKKAERRQAFYRALWAQIDDLKRWEGIYRTSIEKAVFEPFSDTWAYCVNELQKTEYRLDILCAADYREYMRLKPYHENLPSDRYKWLLDVLAVLAECGVFQATAGELKEIKAQAAFEVQRKPGAERRCKIDW